MPDTIAPVLTLRQFTTNPQIRAIRGVGDEAVAEFAGHASVAGVWYEVWDWYGRYEEQIAPGAFAECLRDDVRFLVNHNRDLIGARTVAGNMTLEEDPIGLAVAADLPLAVTYIADLVENLRLGNLTQMSFAFDMDGGEETWEWATEKGALDRKTINRIGHLYDVSVVTYPANPNTDAGLRAAAESAFALYTRGLEPEAIVALTRRLATDIPSGDVELSFAEHADRLVGAFGGFARRAQHRASMRASEGRHLSDADKRRLTSLRSLADGLPDLDSGLEVAHGRIADLYEVEAALASVR